MTIVEAALEYSDKGFSPIPFGIYDKDGKKVKKPAIATWDKFKSERMDVLEIKTHFHSRINYIGLVTGVVSGGLEVIDVDTKYYVSYQNLFTDLWSEIAAIRNDLTAIKTLNGGYHIPYRCDVIGGSKKVASRPANEDELANNPHERTFCFIETRGEGGLIVVPPSDGYEVVYGDGYHNLPTITTEERDQIFAILYSYNELIEAPKQMPQERTINTGFIQSPFDDYNKRGNVSQILTDAGWIYQSTKKGFHNFCRPGKSKAISGGLAVDGNFFKSFTSNSVFEPEKWYSASQVLCKLKFNDNFSNCCKWLLDQGYGIKNSAATYKQRMALIKAIEDGEDPEVIGIEKLKIAPEHIAAVVDQVKSKLDKKKNFSWFRPFWVLSQNSKGEVSCKVNILQFQDFLYTQLGVSLFFSDENTRVYRLVEYENKEVQEISIEYIKKKIKDYIFDTLQDYFQDHNEQELVMTSIVNNELLFSSGRLEWLNRSGFKIMTDDEHTGNYFYKNGVVRVTNDGIRLMDYSQIGDFGVWRKMIIDHKFELVQDTTKTIWADFCQKISGDELNYNYLRALIGYCLHKYKSRSHPRSVFFGENIENPKDGGGAGKGILISALQKIVGGMTIDAENFKPDSGFAFQRYELGTPFICLEDASKKTNFEKYKSIITEGLTVDKKNKDQMYLSFEHSPKILWTGNYSPDTSANYMKRRFWVFAFECFFNVNNTPADYYGQMLFDDWDNDQWNGFYNFQMECVQYYLKNGVAQVPTINMDRKAIRSQFGEDILDYIDNCLTAGTLGDHYLAFINGDQEGRKMVTKAKFRTAVETAIKTLKLPFCIEKTYDKDKKTNVIKIMAAGSCDEEDIPF